LIMAGMRGMRLRPNLGSRTLALNCMSGGINGLHDDW
jgi:hypothetical protein